MSRHCLIGNSHLAAVRQALGGAAPAGSDLFGATLAGLSETVISGSELVPMTEPVAKQFHTTSGGQTRIALDQYDALFAFMAVSPFYLPGYWPGFAPGRITYGLFDRICLSWSQLPLVQVCVGIARAMPDLPVHFIGQPFLSAGAPKAQTLLNALPGEAEIGPELAGMRARIAEHLPALLPENMVVHQPPARCLEPHGLFTRAEFSRGSVRLMGRDQAHPPDDHVHMNADYGQAVLDDIVGAA